MSEITKSESRGTIFPLTLVNVETSTFILLSDCLILYWLIVRNLFGELFKQNGGYVSHSTKANVLEGRELYTF